MVRWSTGLPDQEEEAVTRRAQAVGDCSLSAGRRLSAQATTKKKETCQLTAIRVYEKVCDVLKPPSVDKFFKLYQAKKVGLEQRQARMNQKFGSVVGLLQQAIGDRVKLEVADAPAPAFYNPALTSMSYNREAAKEMALLYRREGLLALFADQMELLAQHAALEPDGKGGMQYDPTKHVKVYEEMLHSFVAFAKTPQAPKRLVRVGYVPSQTQTPAQPGTKPASKGPRAAFARGPRVGGFLIKGTAIATVYERLQDELEHDLQDVIAGITTTDPVGRVKQLDRYGKRKGTWTVTIKNDKVQLVTTKPATAVQP